MRVKTTRAMGERTSRAVGGVRAAWLLYTLSVAWNCSSKQNAAVRDSTSVAAAASKSTSGTDAVRPDRRRSLLFVGTSITAGLGLDPDSAYPALIQLKIDSAGLPFTVTNAGSSGETTAGLLERLDWLLRGDFDVMVLETGANDGLRGIPAASVRSNIETALRRIAIARPNARVILVQMEVLPNLGPRYAAEFHAVYAEVAKANQVTLMPFLLEGVAGRTNLNQGDGIHPNNAGERIVADNVWKALLPVLTGR
jgi:acyl-CoA thioesterase-1